MFVRKSTYHTNLYIWLHIRTTDLDCLLNEPLDLVEESECEAADWLGDEAPDCEHDLSAAQSVEQTRHK